MASLCTKSGQIITFSINCDKGDPALIVITPSDVYHILYNKLEKPGSIIASPNEIILIDKIRGPF